MRLYLDLNKALPQVSAVGRDQKSGERAQRGYEESFTRDHAGVAGGDPTVDKPEVGRKWKHADAEDDEKKDKELLEDPPTNKAQDAVDILKSLCANTKTQLQKSLPNEREIEYLTQELGYSYEDVIKGRVGIMGRERDRFNAWLYTRLQKSISRFSR